MDLESLFDEDVAIHAVSVAWVEDDLRVDITESCSDFEAVGLLRAALRRLERANAESVTLPDDEAAEEDDDVDE